MKQQETMTRKDFERLQQTYSKGYFELYKKYYIEKEKIKKALDVIYCWGETLNPRFQKEIIDILKGESENDNK